MCIAILNTKQDTLNFKTFQNIHFRNGDGLGVTGILNGKFKVYKTLNSVSGAFNFYKKLRKESDHPILVHARIGTHGKNDLENVHPYNIGKFIQMIHNGIVSIERPDETKSDTYAFCRFLERLYKPENVVVSGTLENQISDLVAGNSSKFCFLRLDGKFHISNESAGHWNSGTWYSNDTYKSAYGYMDKGGLKVYEQWTRPKNNGSYWETGRLTYMKAGENYRTALQRMCVYFGIDPDLSNSILYNKLKAEARKFNLDSLTDIHKFTEAENVSWKEKGKNGNKRKKETVKTVSEK